MRMAPSTAMCPSERISRRRRTQVWTQPAEASSNCLFATRTTLVSTMQTAERLLIGLLPLPYPFHLRVSHGDRVFHGVAEKFLGPVSDVSEEVHVEFLKLRPILPRFEEISGHFLTIKTFLGNPALE